MSETEQDPPPPEEEAPPAPAPEDAAPPGSDVPAPPEPEPEPELEPGDQAPPPPSGEEAEQEEAGVTSAGEAVSGEDAIPLEKDRSPSASDILNLIPSDGNIVLPDDDEPDLQRSRSRPAPRMVQSVLSEILSQGSLRSSKYRRSMSGMPNLQETLKEKQARFRDARENRKMKIDPSYKYIFEILSEKLGLDLVTIEELLLDCPSLEPFAHFFMKDGRKTLKILYQEGDAPGVECGRTIPGATKGAKMMRLYIDNAAPEKLKGLCVFFVRCRNDVAINTKNIHEEVLFTVLDASEGLLIGIRDMLANIFLPALLATNNWGALNQSKQGEYEKHIFTETINRYLSFLDGARISIEGTVKLKKIDNVDFSKLQTFEDVTAAANNSETVRQLEDVLMIWYKQIEQVLIESEQMRKEADDSGPLTELEHWKRMSAKFNYIIEQIKGPSCKAVINVLNIAHSKLLKNWRDLDARITDTANESKDNVRYLYTLEKVCQPLYNYDLVSMAHGIQNLINAIRMIHSVSRYYNTSERMTSLFIKVTNQMVTACKAYITDGGINHVWDQETPLVLKKIQDCIFLFKEYQASFHKTRKQILESSGEKSFEVSEMYIFGKFEAFCKRLEKITEMITVVQTYSALSNSTIEGIDIMAIKFKNIYQGVKKKQYDILDPRRTEFDTDFLEFMSKISALEIQIQAFMNSTFGKILSSQQALQLLQRFQKLNIPCLQSEINHTIERILHCYVAELEAIKKLYHSQKDDPPLARNMPPVAGKILWVRQLYRRISEPINYFFKNSEILSSVEGKAVIRQYNKISYVLVEFEVVYHTAWVREISQLQYALQATLFVRHPESGKLLVNFDPKILEVVRETKCMIKMKLDVPEQARRLLKLESKLKADKLYLQGLLQYYDELCQEVPTVFVNLMTPKMKKVESVLRQGLTILTWSSLTLESFFQEVDSVLNMFNQLLKKISDLCEMHIDTVLKEIAKTVLISLPESGATKVEDMLTLNETYTKEWAEILNHKSKHVEQAVRELISIFETIYEVKYSGKTTKQVPEQRKHVVFGSETEEGENTDYDTNIVTEVAVNDKEDEFKKECREVYAFFSHQLLDSLQKATRLSLDTMKKRIFVASLYGRKRSEDVISFIQTEVHLAIPNVVMIPSLDDIQQAINRMIQLTLEVSRGVAHWGQQQTRHIKPVISSSPSWTTADPTHPSTGKQFKKEEKSFEEIIPARKLKNFYPGVAEHKDISKLVLLLSSSVNSLRKVAHEALQDFQKYKTLWTEDRDVKVKEFLANNPSLTEIRSEILHYATFEQEIDELKPVIVVGALELHTEPMKLALSIEAKAWKMLLCRYLNEEYKKKMSDMIAFINDYLKKLSRPIRDLDDVRFAMEALSCIRDNEIQMDMTLGPIEEAYAILNRFEVEVTKEESEAVDTLRYSFNKLQSKAVSVQDELVQVQPQFKSNLLESVEVFREDVMNFADAYEMEGPMVPNIPPQEASNRLQIFQANFDDLWRKFVTYSSGEQLFGLPVTDYEVLHKVRKELNLLQKLYGLYDTVMGNISGYYEILWGDVDIEKINAELQEFQNRCRKLPKGLKDWQAFLDLKKRIDDFSESCPLLEMMTNKAMKQRHWDRISELTGTPFDVESDSFCLRNIMEAPLLKNKDDIEDICISAIKEKDIEAKLTQVIENWSNQNLSFAAFKGKGELLLKGSESGEIITLMEDSLMILGSLLSNRYNAPFKKNIQNWVYKLSTSSDIIEEWLVVQNLWVYLEAVFVGGDIAKQLPQEAKRFQNIDKSWVKIMQRAHENPNVISCCVGDETMGQLLPHLHEQLEVCQKSLTGYLEKKRLLFPRFFFVSDPVLLEILGQASDSHTIQPHLPAVSDNINEVSFHAKDYDRMLAVISREGEKIILDVPVMAKGPVEIWLLDLLKMQMSSLHNIIRSAFYQISDTGFQLLPFLNHFPAQVGLLGIQMLWTHDSEEALNNAKDDRKIMQMTNQKFLDILNTLISQTTHDLSKFERVKFETLITIHVHQRDIFDDLVKMHIKSVTDFEWLKQSRFYFKEDLDQTVVSITDVDFIYQNEFLGCTDRLVITPLTDRCYITLAQALGMNMGGAPAGPAGTGKTETTKDMGRCLGKYVVVFNCSDQMDFRGLGRIFKGLAQSGSWGCFDEFNRIELPVLSVAAQQIYIVLTARKERKKQFIFSDGDCVDLNPEFGIFLTMNPGYAGRQELPENLKIQFRTVAMMVPDRQIIMRVKLASCGFLENVILAQKFYVLYKLCEEQLTKQVHYDFGLRNILSVLRTLGSQKRARPEDSELSTVMRGLRDMNLSKLVDEDEPLFLSLINDLFPGLQLDSSTYAELQTAVANQVRIEGLINHPPWNLKLVQLYETSLVRHGLMTLGPSGSGKTTVITILMKALTECGRPHREMRMNPKAITAPQMFGRLDTATNDWTDGIFSTLWRKTLKAKKGENIFLILDGPVDAIWIENLNSVLDDNKTLTLANGDRIPMSPSCKLLFEVHNIENASPATVSRMGMVYISSSALSWKPILQAWLNKRTAQEASVFQTLYDKIFEDIHVFMKLNLNPKMNLLECNYIVQSLTLLEGLIPSKEEGGVSCVEHLHKLFVFGLMWSLGALLELESRDKLEAFLRHHESKLDLPTIPKGTNQTMYEFYVTDYGDWEHWNKKLQPYFYPTDSIPEYSSILVPNVDNIRTNFLIDTIAKQNKAVLLIGEQGTAKTVMVKAYLKKYDPEVQLSKSLNFSSATEPMMFQRTIESYVDKRMGSTYGPPGGRKMTVFIDDINMPVINEWGDQITNEIVRQMMEMEGMYSLDKPGDFTTIVDVQLIAAMIHPGGGRNDIPQRLKRQFTVFNCTLPSNASIDKIFGVIGCGYFDPCRNFKPEICEMISNLVSAGRVLWQWTKVKMLPTPSKFHYIFNLRDLSRIWQGMLTIKAEECDSISILLSLFKHECNRVVADRFITPEDEHWFNVHLLRAIEESTGSDMTSYIFPEPYFVDFLREMPEPTGDEPEDTVFEIPKIYELIPSFEFLCEKLQFYQRQFNELIRGTSLDLVFFKDAMTHLIKISRIIRTSCGNALLVGVGGSGKQSLSRLASFIAGYQIFQITLTRSYNVSNLTDDLKFLYKVAGADGKGITFIFTDNEIKDEAFLEYLNNLLSSGEISNLFARDEMDEITQSLISVMKKELPRHPPTFDNLYEYFISRSRKNLHVVLCFSPVGEKFRARSLKFPGLISGCTMDWFSRWPKEALIAVASYFLLDYAIVCSSDTKRQVVETMGLFHDMVSESCESYFQRYRRRAHVTPKSYLSFINGYKNIYTEKVKYINEQAERMNIGLDKLMEASESVAKLSQDLAVKEKELAVASVKADEVLAEVTVSAQASAKVKNEVQEVKDKAQKIVDEIDSEKVKAETKLEAAKPALEEAEAALNTIKPNDIATVRKLAKPPHLIMRIMDCVLLLFQKKIDPVTMDPEKPCCKPSWGESLKLMSATGFLWSLQQFPKDTINEETVELLQPYFNMDDYTFESAKKVCGNVAGLLSWTLAMATFYGINREVLPLKANLAKQEGRLAVANAELGKAQALLDEKQAELDKVQAKFDAAMNEKMDLLNDADMCRKKMQAASALIDGLSGEKIRWTQQSKEFKAQINRLVGDILLCTGFLSYLGPFNQIFRNFLLKDQWEIELRARRIPFTENLNLISMLVDPPTIGEWGLQGLPGDDLSIQNGIIVTKATRYPLLIDPQTQGKTWIKSKEKENDLQVTSLNHKYFRTHLEDSLSLGRPLLIEDIREELDPALDNVLEKNFIKSGTAFKVKIGDKECDIMDTFKLYITTKLPNPAFTPEINAKTSVIDFTVTMKGLENQLLRRVILTEKQELESERVKLLEDVTFNKRKMKELEDNLLYKLSATKGSLVDDESLIGVLRTTKLTAAEVSEKLHVAAETEVKINTAQEEFRPAATRGSILYFLITEMSMVNIMYQTSLAQFLKLFDQSMARSEKSPLPQKRITNIIEYLTYEVFTYSVRGLYENHKFLFVLLMTLKIDLQRGTVKHKEFQALIKGGAALDLKACPPKPFRWILDMTWLNLVELSKLPQFAEIMNQISRNEKGWKSWFDKDAPEEEIIPDGYNDSLDTCRKLLLIRSWCPDRTVFQARKYIADSLEEKYTEPVILNLEKTWEESDTRTPLICFLSMGSDPTIQIDALAKKLKLECRTISMGQGQEVHARKLIQMSMQQGGWVLLQNCHLGLEFMDELLDTIITTEANDDSFRVWITTEPHDRFPITLLQTSLKFTNEPPQGVRAGLKRTFAGINQDLLDISNLPMWKPMLYTVAFLHSTVQERRKFGPLGWNIPYEFNSADFTASVQFIQNHLDECDIKKGVSWSTVRYMIGEVQYGGRVTDDFDKRLLNCFARVWFSEKMFEPSFSFYTGYKIPLCKTLDQYFEYIQSLPSLDNPEVFGLHPNADITYQSNTASAVLETITNIQPKESGGGVGETREAIVYRLSEDMLNKLPPDYIPHEVKARLIKMGHLNSMNIFLRQEIDRMQKVISILRNSLSDLKLAIEGTIIMSENLRDALDNMYDARIPQIWKRVSWDSSTLGFWFTELLERNAQFSTWIFEGRPNVFWMTGFFNPQGFLTAMRQEVTRAHKGWALDSVTIHNEVLRQTKEEITSPPAEGVYIYGLYMDGAAWDRRNGKLTESTPKVLFTQLPVLHIFAINSTAPKDPKLYVCPIYKKPRRTDLTFITVVYLRTVLSPDHWILRGVALLCDIK
ncbi:dynein heavy chain 8, axonemal isoform X1 [Rousettus aegyptiacus]|uniref:Dynein axonemal heavy chain 8 n=1 Tax=Rousettus aegyptiacus TaxID=9407 RepID=A0A7J8K773_ROUAE|nr:dynein heavy chain 8, axonemal isoform X1 [Rousettus aegyptiacus]KAF6504698.1 dynein axonemal heavy chain 8 [Rousettus aegyptiacus]